MAGKWAFLKGKFDERTDDRPEYAQRFTELKTALAGLNFEQLSEALTDNVAIKSDLAQKLSDASLNVTVIERLIIEKLEAAGIESITAGGYRLTPSVEPNFSKRDGHALRQWATETGQEDLLTIHSQTLASLAKDWFLEHGEAPPGVETTGIYTKLSRTKVR